MLQTRANKFTWLGHGTFRIITPSGKVILIDPWVQGNPACPDSLKTFDRIDTMVITHGHFDHIGDAVELAKKHTPQVVAIYETCMWLGSKRRDESERDEQGRDAESGRKSNLPWLMRFTSRHPGRRSDYLRWRSLRLYRPTSRRTYHLSRGGHDGLRRHEADRRALLS